MKKILSMLLVIVMTASLAIGGTLAFLTDKENKTNVFTVGNLDISLEEDVGKIGEGAKVEKTEDADGNTTGARYDGIMPGDYLKKEVTVTNNEENNDAYVAVTVTLKNKTNDFVNRLNKAIDEFYEGEGYTAEEIQAIYDEVFDGWGINYSKDLDGDGQNDKDEMRLTITGEDMPEYTMQVDSVKTIDEYWLQYTKNWFSDEDTVIPFDGYYTSDMDKYQLRYTYYLYLPAEESSTLFNGLNVPEYFDADQLAMFDDLEIDIEAAAIQVENIPGGARTETEAKNAFSILAGNGEYTSMPTTNWSEFADTAWYDASASSYTIDTAEELAGLAKLVNEGNTFSKKTIVLGDDINLEDHQWTPIGNNSAKFQGNFDGNNKTISNLFVDGGSESYIGLFGFTTNGTIKNFTVDTATVKGYLGIGVVAGSPYTTKYDNITVTGLIKVDGFSYVGGFGGRNCYADVSNVTIAASEGSYVKAYSIDGSTAYRTYVGGVIGFMGEGGHTVSNVTSNIDVIGSTCDVGGITGIAHYGNKFINCSSSGDVTITDAEEIDEAEEIGGIAGVWNNSTSSVTIKDCSYTGKLSANVAADLSDNTIVGAPYNSTGTGTLVIE